MNTHRHLRWLHKDKLSTAIALLVLVLIVAVAIGLVQKFQEPRTTLRLGDGIFSTHVAATGAERQKGLGDIESLADNEAMLLAFDHEAEWSIWMKDVEYPIDVIWLDDQKQVVHIVKNMPPDSYPDSFSPDKPARYVVELAAGTVEKKAIRIGGVARFDMPEQRTGGAR